MTPRPFTVRIDRRKPDCLHMAIGLKVHKRAVVRNRLKRLVREWYQRNQHRLRGRVLVVASPDAVPLRAHYDLVAQALQRR